MRQGKDGRSNRHIIWNLHREVLVLPTWVWSVRRKGTSVKNIAKPIGRLWADSIVAGCRRKGNADFSATYNGILKPVTSMNRCMVDRVLSAYRPKDLSGEVLACVEDSPIRGVANVNGLA